MKCDDVDRRARDGVPVDRRRPGRGRPGRCDDSGAHRSRAPVTFQPAAAPTKRRGSMVGYIEDATIRTRAPDPLRRRLGDGLSRSRRVLLRQVRLLSRSRRLAAARPRRARPRSRHRHRPQVPAVQRPWAMYAVNDRVRHLRRAAVPLRSIPKEFVPGTGSFENQIRPRRYHRGRKFSLFTDDTRDVTLLAARVAAHPATR